MQQKAARSSCQHLEVNLERAIAPTAVVCSCDRVWLTVGLWELETGQITEADLFTLPV